jgi:hypothetical protein
MTRGRRYRIRHKDARLCEDCADLSVNATHCEFHRLKHAERSRRWLLKNKIKK